MKESFTRRIATLSTLVLLAAAPTCPQSVGPEDVIGHWGGEHIALIVTDAGATVEYDCAHGTIDGSLRTSDDGRFVANGTHVREHGGPIREGEAPDVHPAQYVGQIRGDRMTLTVRETDSGTTIGTFTLQRGIDARVFKCL